MNCLLRREFDSKVLIEEHPPLLKHSLKQLVFNLACPSGCEHRGTISVTRWAAEALPSQVALAPTEISSMAGVYDYAGSDAGVWHVNFADPRLFVAYGSRLLAQDELQAAEHPLLGSVREALIANNDPALTEENDRPTPMLISGVERRCAVATMPDITAGRPFGLYGNRFAQASAEEVARATRVLQPPTRTNLIAMAAPVGRPGLYFPKHIERILITAYTGFRAAVEESGRLWPRERVEVRTGFWGCGAFGGNRELMTLLQLLAARLARVDVVRLYCPDHEGQRDFLSGKETLEGLLRSDGEAHSLAALLESINDLDYEWGVSDGN